MKPMLCRVPRYSEPVFPSPTTSFTFSKVSSDIFRVVSCLYESHERCRTGIYQTLSESGMMNRDKLATKGLAEIGKFKISCKFSDLSTWAFLASFQYLLPS